MQITETKIVGVIYDRSHTREINAFGGLANKMPMYTGFVTVAFFAAIGLPSLSGFISEALVFVGAFGVEEIRTLTIIGYVSFLVHELSRALRLAMKKLSSRKAPQKQGIFYVVRNGPPEG